MTTDIPAGYKLTEVGVIPGDWEIRAFAEVATLERGKFSARPRNDPKYYGGTIPFIQTGDVTNANGNITSFSQTLNEAGLRVSKLFPRDTLFFTIAANIGDVGFATFDTACPDSLVAITPNTQLDKRWLYQELMGRKKVFEGLATQNAQLNINLEKLRPYLLPIPPLPEQRAIATALSDVDALLAKLDALIAKKRDLKQATMQQLLTGQTRLPGFSGAWELKTIEELEKIGIVKLSRGEVISKKDIRDSPGEYPIYSSSVKNDGLFGRYGKHMFDEEMITWSVDGGGNFFHRSKHKFSVTNVCGYMRLDTSKIGYRFFAAQLQHLHSSLNFDYQDKAHPSVIRKAYSVFIPSANEQAAIATILTDMDTELAALQARRDKTHALKQGMMQALLTGRIRLVPTTPQP